MNDGRRRRGLLLPLAALVVALVVEGCAAGASSPAESFPTPAPPAPSPTATNTPAPSPTAAPMGTPTATPGGSPLTQAEAVALVLAQDQRFAVASPPDPKLIGQSAWYEVSPALVGWRVTVTIGWGDCQAGCIARHTWVYDVDPAGTVTLVEERGDPLQDGSGGG